MEIWLQLRSRGVSARFDHPLFAQEPQRTPPHNRWLICRPVSRRRFPFLKRSGDLNLDKHFIVGESQRSLSHTRIELGERQVSCSSRRLNDHLGVHCNQRRGCIRLADGVAFVRSTLPRKTGFPASLVAGLPGFSEEFRLVIELAAVILTQVPTDSAPEMLYRRGANGRNRLMQSRPVSRNGLYAS